MDAKTLTAALDRGPVSLFVVCEMCDLPPDLGLAARIDLDYAFVSPPMTELDIGEHAVRVRLSFPSGSYLCVIPYRAVLASRCARAPLRLIKGGLR